MTLIYAQCIKRILSLVISMIGLILLMPVMLIIAITIKVTSEGKVVFKQKRIGKDMKEFTIYKFRTMIENAYEIGGTNTFENDPRITKVGSFLRKTSLDELPQMINILKGDMCIIGPRPILSEEFEPYKNNLVHRKRLKVRPGLFCTVDIDHRANASRELQFEMDANYVDNISFKLDLIVFLHTFISVIKRKNVYKQKE